MRPNGLVVFVVSLVVLAAAVVAWGPSRPMLGDAAQYLAIGKSLAGGSGYRNTVGPWANAPAHDRMPAWPVMIAAAITISPVRSPEAITRFLSALCLAMAGGLFASLGRQLGLGPWMAVAASLAMTLSPPLVFLSLNGLSEVSFVLFVLAGWWLLYRGGRWVIAAGLVFGAASLVRTNFILFPVAVLVVLFLFPGGRRYLSTHWRPVLLTVAVAYLLPLGWAIRNYPLVHRFPFLSSLEGETLWGSNNDRVANDLKYWGYWVDPDEIPGEEPKLELAKRMNQLELNDYYHARGVYWIKSHIPDLPRLALGKLVRAFVPVPWLPHAGSYIAFSYRFLLDVVFLILIPWWWPVMERRYLMISLALLLVSLVSILMYWGVYRFTHVYVEIFLIGPIFVGLQQVLSNRRLNVQTDRAH